MSNPPPPTFNYSNLPFTVAVIGNQLVFTFTIPTKPGLQLSNPIYVNTANMTIEKDRFNANLVEIGDDKGVFTLNYLNQVPPAGSLNAFIAALLALIPVPAPPVVYTLATAAGATGTSLVANGAGPNFTIYDVKGTGTTTTSLVGSDVIINSASTDVTLANAPGTTGVTLVNDGTGPSLAINAVKGAGTSSAALVGTDVVITSASTDVTLANAAGTTGVSIVVDGTGPSLTVNDIKAGAGIGVALVGSDIVITNTGSAPPSPAFIALHAPDIPVDYAGVYENKIFWDIVTQNSTDVTYNAGTFEFLCNVTADYFVQCQMIVHGPEAQYWLGFTDSTSTVLALGGWAAPFNSAMQMQFGTAVPGDYDYDTTVVDNFAQLATIVHLTSGTSYFFGLYNVTLVGSGFTITDGGYSLTGASNCSIKRLL